MAQHNKTGKIGEDIARRFLMKRGFEIVEQNYNKKWGEIDIIAKKYGILHFVEVKSVSSSLAPASAKAMAGKKATEDKHENTANVTRLPAEASAKAGETYQAQPEEMVHAQKQKRLARAIQTYLTQFHMKHVSGLPAGASAQAGETQKGAEEMPEWQFDIAAVFINHDTKTARVRLTKNVIL